MNTMAVTLATCAILSMWIAAIQSTCLQLVAADQILMASMLSSNSCSIPVVGSIAAKHIMPFNYSYYFSELLALKNKEPNCCTAQWAAVRTACILAIQLSSWPPSHFPLATLLLALSTIHLKGLETRPAWSHMIASTFQENRTLRGMITSQCLVGAGY